MGGFALAVWVRHHFRSIPVVLTSGVDFAVRPLDRQNLIPFLAKPYRMEDAEKLIVSVLADESFAARDYTIALRASEVRASALESILAGYIMGPGSLRDRFHYF